MAKSIENIFAKLFGGTTTDKFLKEASQVVEEINQIVDDYQNITDDELKAKTQEFKYRLHAGETLDDILPEAFATVKETCKRLLGKNWVVRGQEITWDMVPYDVQLVGALALHQGKIAEMATGEGKTLVATMPLYLNALSGEGAHLVTVNDYLAQRDCEWMGKVYEFLGLKAVALHGDLSPEEKRDAYNADITYGTNNEFGFDYLRDNMAIDVWSVVQRPLNYVIIDEVDSILIDEARTPLIISGSVGAPRNVYRDLKPIVANLYKKQKELVEQLIREGKALLDRDEEKAGLILLRAQRGDPKNPALLELLTSEFWVKKLIERIQGQFEINKTMSEVDAELYFTIDEKSNVVDITEKGRIFLSGGQDEDIVRKIKILDDLDNGLQQLSKRKDAVRYYNETDSVSGMDMTLEGKLFLCGASAQIEEAMRNALSALDERMHEFPDAVSRLIEQKNMDKNSAWRRFYNMSKKTDKLVQDISADGIAFLKEKEPDQSYQKAVQGLEKLFEFMGQESSEEDNPRIQNERRQLYIQTLFELSSQSHCPIGLTDEGKAAVIAILQDVNPEMLPFIHKIRIMLSQEEGEASSQSASPALLAKHQDYFEFADNGLVIKHITEKGRIALLGGNPDLYVLPDRSIVENRDQSTQELLDRTLNQSQFDYIGRVQAIEKMNSDLTALCEYEEQKAAENQSSSEFYKKVTIYDQERIQFTDKGMAVVSDYASQTESLLNALDAELRKQDQNVFQYNDRNQPLSLNKTVLDELLGVPYSQIQGKIKEWQHNLDEKQDSNSVRLRLSLDDYLFSHFSQLKDKFASPSRIYEELERIDRVFKLRLSSLTSDELSPRDKQRVIYRYFNVDGEPDFSATETVLKISGLSDSGFRLLMGEALNRRRVVEKLVELTNDPDIDSEALFELSQSGYPRSFKNIAKSRLIDGLPFYRYEKEFSDFREEILRISSKKVNSRSELENILPKDKTHLKNKGILLDERELNDLLSKAHAPNLVLTQNEIESWFHIHFERKPQRELERQRDRLWRDYNRVEERIQNISQLLKAYTLFHKDVDYVVKTLEESDLRRHGGGKGKKAVMIVDQFTGRLMPGRRFSEGLHEALEAKENVEVQAETQTLATITIQNFFRLYKKIAGMTGTAETESQEFFSTYKLDVVVIPTNKPVVRDDCNDVIYRTKNEKYNALIEEAIQMHEQGRAILIGTISVDVSERLSQLLTRRGIPVANWLKKGDVSSELESGKFHTVLNAKFHKSEAEIVAKAGLPGSITIATNMAGRGTDIKLHPAVKEKGGLHIIGSEKHEARRIDRQLRGRAGRQGDPGSSRFYLCLEDDLMRLFGSDRITNIMSRLGPSEQGERIEHPLITRSIERAQKKVEERNFEIRKQLLEYDDVLNEQRKIIYKRRLNLLGFAEIEDMVESKAKRYFGEEDNRATWDVDGLITNLKEYFNQDSSFSANELESQSVDEIKNRLGDWISQQLDERHHIESMRIRHRILGCCQMDELIEYIVDHLIHLHRMGKSDFQSWNLEGLETDLERIFNEKPDVRQKVDHSEQLRTRLIEWAKQVYREDYKEQHAEFEQLLFGRLSFEEFVDVFLFAIMHFHLNPAQPPVSWESKRFFHDLERVFGSTPEVGLNEIRTIRRQKLKEILRDWVTGLNIHPDNYLLYRHRILGLLSLSTFVDALALSCLVDEEGRLLRDDFQLVQKQQLLDNVFGEGFAERNNTENQERYRENILQSTREAFNSEFRKRHSAYDTVMLAGATNDAFIQAVVQVVVDQAIQSGNADKTLSQMLDFIFLNRPEKLGSVVQDQSKLDELKKDLIAWALRLHSAINYQQKRLEQARLSSEIVRDSILTMIDDTLYNLISNLLGESDDLDRELVGRLQTECRLVFRQSPRIADDGDEAFDPAHVLEDLNQWAQSIYLRRIRELGEDLAARYERYYMLEKIDDNWRQHLHAIDELREGIGLRGYGQKDPLLEYKSEAYKMFVQTIDRMNRDVVSTLFNIFDVGGELEEKKQQRSEPKEYVTTHSQVQTFQQTAPATSPAANVQSRREAGGAQKPQQTVKVGRNDPCPCGSGKKYKQCCGSKV